MKRTSKGNFLDMKDMQFGDGKFIFKGVRGVVVATRVLVPLLEYLEKSMEREDFLELLGGFSKGYLREMVPEGFKIKIRRDSYERNVRSAAG